MYFLNLGHEDVRYETLNLGVYQFYENIEQFISQIGAHKSAHTKKKKKKK